MEKEKTQLKSIDAPNYSYWEALYLAFYSRPLFVDVGKRWRGMGLTYLLLLLGVLSIPFSISIALYFNTFFNQQLIEPINQMPTLYVQNGNASMDKPMPYLIKNEKGQVVLIIDTTDSITSFIGDYPYLNILINKNQISYRMPTPQLFHREVEVSNVGIPIVQKFSKDVNTVFNGHKLVEESNLTRLKLISQLMIYPIVVGILLSIFVVVFPVLALMGQLFGSVFFAFKMNYLQASRMLIVASTPMMLLLMIFLTLNILFNGMGFILFALLIAYYAFGLAAFRAESRRVAVV